MRRIFAAAALSALCWHGAAGCAATTATGPDDNPPVQLVLKRAHGGGLALSELRGKPVLLFLFATYDSLSQLALTPLSRFMSTRDDLQAVGIAIQPDPERFLHIFSDTLSLHFPLAYEPANSIPSGKSPLGVVPAVPTYILLDAQGRILARRTGGMDHHELEAFVEDGL